MPIVTARSEGEALPSGQLIKAIYDYTADVLESKVLSFASGDHFVVIKSTKPEEWLYVVSAAGRLGYIPANFITIDILPDKSYLNLLDKILATLSANSSSASNPPNGASADILTVRQINHAKVKLSQVRAEIASRITGQANRQTTPLEKRASINTLDDVESTATEAVEESEKNSVQCDRNECNDDDEVKESVNETKSITSNQDKCEANETSPDKIDPVCEEKVECESNECIKGVSRVSGSKCEGREESVKGSSKEGMIEKDTGQHKQESREGHAEDGDGFTEHVQVSTQEGSRKDLSSEIVNASPASPLVDAGDDDDRAEADLETSVQKIENKDTAVYSSTSKVEQDDECEPCDKLNINSHQNTVPEEDCIKNTHDKRYDGPAQVEATSLSTHNNASLNDGSIRVDEEEPCVPSKGETTTTGKRGLDLPLEKNTMIASPADENVAEQNDGQKDEKVKIESFIHHLIERVRVSSDLSHGQCKKTIAVVLSTLAESYTQWSDDLNIILRQLRESSAVTPASNHHWLKSSDMEKLQKIFTTLLSVSSNEQQRSWPIHEDEQVITNLLVDLNKVLTDANPLMTREFVASNDFDNVTMLTTYFQMETRRSIRLQLLRVMIQIIKLENRCISEVFLSHSGVPASLADELKCHLYDDERWPLAAKLLTLVFATGHKPPITIYEHINEKFASFLMAVIEGDVEQLLLMGPPGQANTANLNGRPSSAAGRATPLGPPCELPPNEISIPLLLALNLHLQSSFDDNFILSVLAKKQTCSQLTENLVSFLNWEEDPTFDSSILSSESFTEERKNSVHKLLIEILTYKQTATLFYLNDTRVLMDIVVSHLNNLESQVAKERIACLQIAQQVLLNTSYLEDPPNKMTDLQSCLNGIIAEESLCEEEKNLAVNVQQLINGAKK